MVIYEVNIFVDLFVECFRGVQSSATFTLNVLSKRIPESAPMNSVSLIRIKGVAFRLHLKRIECGLIVFTLNAL